MSYEELPHTADVKIRARAPTPDALFGEACMALMQVMYGETGAAGHRGQSRSARRTRNRFYVISFRKCCMSLKWRGWSSGHAEVHTEGLHLHAVLDGEPFDPVRHNKGTEVKGISYSGMSIKKDAKGYMLDILFDV